MSQRPGAALERERGLDGILRQATVGFAQVEPTGRFVVVNQRYCEIVGRSREELLALRITDITHPDDLPRALPLFLKTAESGEDFEIEKRYVRPDGSSVWVTNSVYALRDASGAPEYVVAICFDITAQKQAQEALRRSEERYRRIFDAVGVSLWEEDLSQVKVALDAVRATGVRDFRQYFADHPDFVRHCVGLVRIADVNAASLRMFRASDKDRLVRSHVEVFDPQTHDVFVSALLAFAEGQSKFEAEAVHRTLDGERLNVMLSITFPHTDDSWASALVSLTDITARKRAEDVLRDSEARLRDAYRSLEHTSRVKDEFLATLSHELRTPLNAVLGWSRMLRVGAMRPDIQARALESIERNAKAQSQLVEDLLDVSRIISGKLQLRSDAVDLAHVIAGAVDATRPGATAKGLTMDVDVDPEAQILVTGDADRLQQVVWNLLSNATKFTPAGGRVRISLGVAGAHARIVVSDTGQGISPSFLPHIFERFRQEDGTLARKHTGLGLGLSIVRHLTEAHGGTITAESDGEGRGATFVTLLPVREIRHSRAQAERDVPEGRAPVRGIRALVVDDDTDARDLVRLVLEAGDADVTLAGSAEEALRLFERDRFDVLVADIGMPSQDGYSLIRAVRALPKERGGRIPTIAVTAYATVRDRERALEAGFDRHLAKPVDPDELTAQVAALCRQTS